MSNAENVQWDYKGLNFLNNNNTDQFQCDKSENFSVIIKDFQCGFSGVSVWVDFSM